MDVREIDALVAEHVMGWVPLTFPDGLMPHVVHWQHDGTSTGLAPFTRNIADAMRVVEKMRETHPFFSLATGVDGWTADFDNGARGGYAQRQPTAPLAICRAALSAKGVSTEQHNTDAIPGETEP